ncbi:hypothetical protein RKLH11_3966 [Rhodobacteraceae bacterium KLH11]|nr:hypothetical protein RKLH11_3966 [Rhodobacteraceae bacterium KLH11]
MAVRAGLWLSQARCTALMSFVSDLGVPCGPWFQILKVM